MTQHKVGTRQEWLAARLALLEAEKEHTRRGDELARRRQEMPWVRIDKKYEFDTDEGNASLSDLFRGRSQLLACHFMFRPDSTAGCPLSPAIPAAFTRLPHPDVVLWACARAPLAKRQAYKWRLGWTLPWASSHSAEVNADVSVRFTEEQQRAGIECNCRRESAWRARSESGDENVFAHM